MTFFAIRITFRYNEFLDKQQIVLRKAYRARPTTEEVKLAVDRFAHKLAESFATGGSMGSLDATTVKTEIIDFQVD